MMTDSGQVFTADEVRRIVRGYKAAQDKPRAFVMMAQEHRVMPKDIREVLCMEGLIDAKSGAAVGEKERTPKGGAGTSAPHDGAAGAAGIANAAGAKAETKKRKEVRGAYTQEQRKDALALLAQGTGLTEAARELGLPMKTVASWKYQARRSEATAAGNERSPKGEREPLRAAGGLKKKAGGIGINREFDDAVNKMVEESRHLDARGDAPFEAGKEKLRLLEVHEHTGGGQGEHELQRASAPHDGAASAAGLLPPKVGTVKICLKGTFDEVKRLVEVCDGVFICKSMTVKWLC